MEPFDEPETETGVCLTINEEEDGSVTYRIHTDQAGRTTDTRRTGSWHAGRLESMTPGLDGNVECPQIHTVNQVRPLSRTGVQGPRPTEW